MKTADIIIGLAEQANYTTPLYYRFLELLAEWWKPRLSVELGVYGGEGSRHLCMGYPEGIVVGVDINPLQAQMPANFHFMQMDSVAAADEYENVVFEIPVDILFIDTTHTYEQTMAEYNAWFQYLNGNALIVMDDLHRPGMMKAWDKIQGYHVLLNQLHVCPDPVDGGFGVVII